VREKTPAVPKLEIRAVSRGDWPVLERLFGANGACGGCWCMWWRVERGGRTWEEAQGSPNRARLRRLLSRGALEAVIAFADGEPVGWCSFGPRASFPRLERSRVLARDHEEDTWSIVCFFLPARWRGRGVATRLLAAATARAFELGAREVEGYPVPVRDPARAVPAAFAWTGVPALFERAGYEPLERQAGLRPIFVRRPEVRAPKKRRKS